MILLHGLGGAQDLPVPAPAAIAAGTAAVAITFAVLAWAWRTPRYSGWSPTGPQSSLLAVLDSSLWDRFLALLGLVAFGWVTWALVAGVDSNANPVFGVFYVLVWVGVLPASLLFGRVAHALSPWRTLTRLRCWAMGTSPDRGLLPYPDRLGYWPAAIGVFAFVWQELVSRDQTSLGAVQLWIGLYALVMLSGTVVFGTIWLDRADPFQVYSDLLAHLSPWGRDEGGGLRLRSPLSNLATLRAAPGMLACLAILFGSTIYDSAKDSPTWTKFADGMPFSPVAVGSAALLASWVIVGATFVAGSRLNVRRSVRPRDLPRLFAPSLVPIIAGYMTAHYLSYFVYQGQIAVTQLSDPLSTGANYLGTGDLAANLWLNNHPTFLAIIKVMAIVAGHIVGAIAAHDLTLQQATADQPERSAPPSAGWAMGVLMLLYTSTGLMLLFGF